MNGGECGFKLEDVAAIPLGAVDVRVGLCEGWNQEFVVGSIADMG